CCLATAIVEPDAETHTTGHLGRSQTAATGERGLRPGLGGTGVEGLCRWYPVFVALRAVCSDGFRMTGVTSLDKVSRGTFQLYSPSQVASRKSQNAATCDLRPATRRV